MISSNGGIWRCDVFDPANPGIEIRTDAPDQRQLERQTARIHAQREPQQIYLDPFLHADGHAGQSEQADLSTRAARRDADRLEAQTILADGRGGELNIFEFKCRLRVANTSG